VSKPNIQLPAIFNSYPQRCDLKKIIGITHISIALKVARNIHMRCRLAEAQNWRCCWCGTTCRPEPSHANSATIEHVQPRSLGGANEWDNYAMACNHCNNKRGVMSVEDMLAGKPPKKKPCKKTKQHGRGSRKKYLLKAAKWNQTGWVHADGSPLCKRKWLDSLRISPARIKAIEDVVFGPT